MTEKEYQHFQDEEREKAKRYREITIDEVFPHEQQPEVEHQLQSRNSHSGYLNVFKRGWRDSRDDGFFSYKMKVDPNQQMYLMVTYNGNDANAYIDGRTYQREFDILIDRVAIATQKLETNHPGSLFEVCYEIPRTLTQNQKQVEVMFRSGKGKIAGGVYGVRITNARE